MAGFLASEPRKSRRADLSWPYSTTAKSEIRVEELAARRLVDEEATHTAVSEAILGTLEDAKEDDVIVISFAGHGSPDGSLVLFDTDPTDLQGTAL